MSSVSHTRSVTPAAIHTFKVSSADAELADANMTYRVVYKLLGEEPAEPSGIEHFARANGAYHTWPFVRETIYSLTARMGFPPYTLPVLSFLPRPKPTPPVPATSAEPISEAAVTSPSNSTPSVNMETSHEEGAQDTTAKIAAGHLSPSVCAVYFPHRLAAARRAMSRRFFADRRSALARPPFRPSSTAALLLPSSV
jgi:hypothetical protein